jgi:hypothetical protein
MLTFLRISHLRIVIKGWTQEKRQLVQRIYEKGGKDNIVLVSDLVRAALVYQYGGVYMDMDTITSYPIMRPTLATFGDEMPCYLKNRSGLELDVGFFPKAPVTCIENGLFALPKSHGLLKHYLELMPMNLAFDRWAVIGPTLFMQALGEVYYTEPQHLYGLYGMSAKCLSCLNTAHPLSSCTTYSYLSFGSTEGGLDEKSMIFFNEIVLDHCGAGAGMIKPATGGIARRAT